MTEHRLRTVVIGFGKIASGYADDPVMAKYYPYASHAQVLSMHPAFSWEAVVDISPAARQVARDRWGIQFVYETVDEMTHDYQPEVAIISTPPVTRLSLIEKLMSVRAVIVEKPLGLSLADGENFLNICSKQELLVQTNYWRRADERFQKLASGQLDKLIGHLQTAFGIYGNGLLNNGSHMIDFVRMLLGEIVCVQALSEPTPPCPAGPIPGDVNIHFKLRLESDRIVVFNPIQFNHYRENSLDIWGEKGRLAIMQEGLGIYHYPLCPNRAICNEWEIATDHPEVLETTVGSAFYNLYSNLADALRNGSQLWSPGVSAYKTAVVMDAILQSAQSGKPIEMSS